MNTFIFSVLFGLSANAYENVSAPFCVMDNYGNLECYYYSLSSCRDATKLRTDSACVKK